MRTFVGILVAAVALGQQPNGGGAGPQQKCVLEGTATDSLSGEALRKVIVRLTPAFGGGLEYVGTTDASGHFHFEGFRPGDYELTGERAGYFWSSLGARRPENRGTILHFSTGETLSDLELKLTRHSSLSGKILDDDGEPVGGAWIAAMRQTWIRGRREYETTWQGSADEAGEYRITGLAPGRYYLRANVQPERFVADEGKPEQEIASAYFPDAPTIETATAFEIEPAQDLTGFNFHLHTREVFHIRGRVSGSDLPRALSIVATTAESILQTWGFDPAARAIVNKDGTFDLAGVLPGAYNLQLWERRGRGSIGTARVQVKASNLEGVVVAADQAFTLTGTVRVDPETAGTAGIDVMLEGQQKGGRSGSIDSKREFRIENVTPGDYVFNVLMGDQTRYVASIRYGGQEVLGARFHISSVAPPVEILIKQGTGQVEGTVGSADPQEQAASEANSAAKPANASTVVLISERVRFDRQGIFFAPTDQNGHCVFKGVPPGKYYALASEDVDQGLWENRDFFAQIQPKAMEVDLPENGKLEIRVPSISDDEVQRAMAASGQ